MEKFKLDEQKLNSLKTYRDKGLRTVIGCVVALSLFTIGALSTVDNGVKAETNENQKFVACYGCSHYDADTNSCIEGDKWSRWCEANFPTKTLEERDEGARYPGKLTADGTSQEMPEIKGSDSHQRFKELSQAYGLDAGMFREIENEYNIREGVLLSIVIAETSGGSTGYGTSSCNNPANNNNNDRGTRVCYDSFREGLIEAAKTLNNSYLGGIQTLGCLSKAGSCKWREDKGYIYASSDGNWERNMLKALNLIYEQELGPIDAERFNVRRAFTIYQ